MPEPRQESTVLIAVGLDRLSFGIRSSRQPNHPPGISVTSVIDLAMGNTHTC